MTALDGHPPSEVQYFCSFHKMIDILLPIYNGERYLREQIVSLEGQTCRDFRIIVRNDGSTDQSENIIHEAAREYDNILVVEDCLGNVGLSRCLEILISHSTAPYFMFCDQDDRWKPDKMEKSIKVLQEIEKRNPNRPVLVCTDSTCVDDEGNVIAESFYESQRFMDVIGDTTKMLAQNVVQGNTCIMNASCKQYIVPFPRYGLYDHWAGVMICHYGIVYYMHEQTLWYRQHTGNVLGANNIGVRYFSSKLLHLRRQCRLYHCLFHSLPFRVNFLRWAFYKVYYSLRRTI